MNTLYNKCLDVQLFYVRHFLVGTKRSYNLYQGLSVFYNNFSPGVEEQKFCQKEWSFDGGMAD